MCDAGVCETLGIAKETAGVGLAAARAMDEVGFAGNNSGIPFTRHAGISSVKKGSSNTAQSTNARAMWRVAAGRFFSKNPTAQPKASSTVAFKVILTMALNNVGTGMAIFPPVSLYE